MSRLSKPERCWRILERLVRQNRPMKTGDLVTLLRAKDPSVTPSLVANDLAKLANLGLVSSLGHGVWDQRQTSLHWGQYHEKLGVWPLEKAAVAKYIVATYLQNATGAIGLDAGTSITAVFRELINLGVSVDLFTNNIDGAWHLMRSNYSGRIELRGGIIDMDYGVATDAGVRKPGTLSLAVVGVSSVTASGLATNDTRQHAFKRWMCNAAARLIVPVTTHKLLKQSGKVFQPMEGLEQVVVVAANNVAGLKPDRMESLRGELGRLSEKVVLVNAHGEMTRKLESWAQSQ